MAWKPKYTREPSKLSRRSFDTIMAFAVILSIVVVGFGLNRVVKYVTGESRVSISAPAQLSTPQTSNSSTRPDITVVDGDTVRSGGVIYRLIGFDTPERGDRALCDVERELAEKASARLRVLIANGEPTLQHTACACRPGTEGTQSCNFGRSCAYLRVGGRDVGEVLIREGLAQPFVCSQTSCSPRRSWC